jgi:CheY-like chemotaxis protein
MDTADAGAHILVSRSGDRAGVQDDNVCRRTRSTPAQSQGGKLLLYGSAISLGGAAAKIFNVVTGHPWTYYRDVNAVEGGNVLSLEAKNNRSCCCCISKVSKPNRAWRIPLETPMKRRILLVDDELAILLTLKAILEIHGFEVETAASCKEAKDKLKKNEYHMVITDMRMETERAGYDVIRAAKKTEYDPAVAVLTAYPMLGGEWKNEGADTMLVKPMNTNDLLRQIESLLVTHEDAKQARRGAPKATAAAARPAEKSAKAPAKAS